MSQNTNRIFLSFLFFFLISSHLVFSQKSETSHAWMNANLSPDERAAMVIKEMTIDEKIQMLHGTGMVGLSRMSPLAIHSNGGAGYVPGIPRLGIPALQMSDAAYGVRMSGENGRYSTALPSDIAGAATWAKAEVPASATARAKTNERDNERTVMCNSSNGSGV